MSKAVLISIKPQWCGQIAQCRKTVELRKTRPNVELPFKAYIYCTNVKSMNLQDYVAVHKATCGAVDDWSGKIIGEFTCDKIDRLTHVEAMGSNEPAKLYIETPDLEYECADDLLQAACLTEAETEKYLKGGDGYGWHISDLKIYDQPLELPKFTGLQSTRFGMRPVEITRPPQSWYYVKERSCSE